MLTKSTSSGNTNTSWIPDSGASFHVTAVSQNITQFQQFNGPDQIIIGNGAGLRICGVCLSLFTSTYMSP